MPRCPAADLAPPSAQLDKLIAQALDTAIRLHHPEVGDALLCALEAHARVTGNTTRLDAVYLRLFAGEPPSVRANRRR